jgi:GAF domain-containing protein
MLLVAIAELEDRVWAVALRGHVSFATAQLGILNSLVPFIAKSLLFSSGEIKIDDHTKALEARRLLYLQFAVDVLQISDLTTVTKRLPARVSQMCEGSFGRIALVDWEKKCLRTNFGNGMKRFEDFDMTAGVAGAAIEEIGVVRVDHPTEDPRFNRELDFGHVPDRDPVSFMTIPIVHGDRVLAVLMVGGRSDGSPFSEADELNLKAIAPVCAVAIRNAQQQMIATNICIQTERAFAPIARQKSRSKLAQAIEALLGQAKALLNATRITFFEGGQTENTLIERATFGGVAKASTEIAQSAASECRVVIKPGADISLPTLVAAVPLVESDSTVLAVLEIEFGLRNSVDDIALVESFLLIAATSFNLSDLRRWTQFRHDRRALVNLIGEGARSQCDTPAELKPPLAEKALLSFSFNVLELSELGLIQCCFALFDQFSLRPFLSITNERLYLLLKTLARLYGDCAWRNAVDVLQYMTYELVNARLDAVLNKAEILALLLAALCCDLPFDPFMPAGPSLDEVFDSVYPQHSLYQIGHCATALTLLLDENLNLLDAAPQNSVKRAWPLFVTLMLKTDLARHFTLLEEFLDLNQSGDLNIGKKNTHRELFMTILLNAATMAALCRPYSVAREMIPILADSFFREGFLAGVPTLEYDDDSRVRNCINRRKSIPIYLDVVAHAIFDLIAHYNPTLSLVMKPIEANIATYIKEIQTR